MFFSSEDVSPALCFLPEDVSVALCFSAAGGQLQRSKWPKRRAILAPKGSLRGCAKVLLYKVL